MVRFTLREKQASSAIPALVSSFFYVYLMVISKCTGNPILQQSQPHHLVITALGVDRPATGRQRSGQRRQRLGMEPLTGIKHGMMEFTPQQRTKCGRGAVRAGFRRVIAQPQPVAFQRLAP